MNYAERNKEIARLYYEGLTHKEIGDTIGLSGSRIQQIVSKLPDYEGHNKEANQALRDDIEEIAYRVYEQGEPISHIGKSYGLSHTSVARALKDCGYEAVSGIIGSRYINHSLLDNWTEESFYFSGWVAGDGSLYDRLISITQKEPGPLKKLANIISVNDEYKPTIQYYERPQKYDSTKISQLHTLSLVSTKLSEALRNEGITERKSLTLEVSERLANSPVFWRAIIEADGSIGIDSNNQSFVSLSTGSEAFAEQYQQWLTSIGVNKTYSQRLTNDWGSGIQVLVNRQAEVPIILDSIYTDAMYKYERKYQAAMEILGK